jgi:hypothetical protein
MVETECKGKGSIGRSKSEIVIIGKRGKTTEGNEKRIGGGGEGGGSREEEDSNYPSPGLIVVS